MKFALSTAPRLTFIMVALVSAAGVLRWRGSGFNRTTDCGAVVFSCAAF